MRIKRTAALILAAVLGLFVLVASLLTDQTRLLSHAPQASAVASVSVEHPLTLSQPGD